MIASETNEKLDNACTMTQELGADNTVSAKKFN